MTASRFQARAQASHPEGVAEDERIGFYAALLKFLEFTARAFEKVSH